MSDVNIGHVAMQMTSESRLHCDLTVQSLASEVSIAYVLEDRIEQFAAVERSVGL